MNKLKILIIVFAIASVALVPSLMSNQNANAGFDHCKERQSDSESEAWLKGCTQGMDDHDRCKEYKPVTPDPRDASDYEKGYRVGWNLGRCG